MEHKRLLVKAYKFLSHSSVFYQESAIDWCSRLNRLYDRGWLYGCFLGERLIALAGAYRIPEWHERYCEHVPEQEYGPNLYISLFVSECERMADPLRLLRHYLTFHPEIREVLYWEKYRRHGRELCRRFTEGYPRFMPGRLKRMRVMHRHPRRFDESLAYKSRLGVLPPEFVSISLVDTGIHSHRPRE